MTKDDSLSHFSFFTLCVFLLCCFFLLSRSTQLYRLSFRGVSETFVATTERLLLAYCCIFHCIPRSYKTRKIPGISACERAVCIQSYFFVFPSRRNVIERRRLFKIFVPRTNEKKSSRDNVGPISNNLYSFVIRNCV